MSADPLLPAYFILGSDRPKVRRAVARLRGRFPAESVEHLTADAVSGADAVAVCNAIGLFGDDGARLVLVEGVERWVGEDVEEVVGYLASPVETNVLALVAEGAPRTTALADAVGSAGKVLRYDAPKPRDLPGWVRAEFERRGSPVDADTARALVEIVGDDVTELASEIDKVVDVVGRRARSGDGRSRASQSARGTRSCGRSRTRGARATSPGVLAACEAILEGRGKEPFAVASALASSVGRVRAAQAMAEEGLGAAEVAKRLRIKDYPARKALGHAKNFTRDELDTAIVRLAELDAALKGASRLGAELQLERALLELDGDASPGGGSPRDADELGLKPARRDARPATSCAPPCSDGARRAQRPGRASGRAPRARRRSGRRRRLRPRSRAACRASSRSSASGGSRPAGGPHSGRDAPVA